MKFSSSLKFNAVGEWWDEYIAYSALKKYIFQLEKQYHHESTNPTDLEATNERSSLLMGGIRTDSHPTTTPGTRGAPGGSGSGTNVPMKQPDRIFSGLLDKELDKIISFYRSIESDVERDMVAVETDVVTRDTEAEGGSPLNSMYYDEDDEEEDEEDEDGKGRSASAPRRQRTASPNDLRYSISDYGELGLSATSANLPGGNNRRGGSFSSPNPNTANRRRQRMPSDAAAASTSQQQQPPPPKSTLANLFERVVPRRRSLSGGGAGAGLNSGNTLLNVNTVASTTNEPYNIWNAKSTYAREVRMLFKRRITNVYNTAVGLKSYAELNYSGFRKILKKYDKVLDSELQGPYLHEKVQRAYPWLAPTKGKLDHWITTLVNLYAKCVTHGDHLAAEKQLELYQREHVVWERDTVWRQMIAQERRGEIGDGPKAIGESTKKGKKPVWIDFESKWGRIRISKRVVYFSVALSVFVALLIKPVLDRPEPSNCFAILCFATVLWATEAIPLFVTSILVPFLLCIFRVIRSQDEFDQRLTTSQATKYIFSVMFSPTIMLLIGGFTIASALSKTNIDRVLITRVLSFAGTRPSTVLLSFMFVSCFASMWISNVAAPTLCFTLIRPILRTLPPKSSFAPCLILAIALAANIGGQSSPISSPQNLIVLQHMDPPLDWLEWFSVALPVSGLSIILIWLFLLLSYKPGRTADGTTLEIKPIRASKEKFTFRQYWVSFVCVVTIGLWCVEHSIEEWVGDMGLVAIIPIVAFFSTGVLKKDDFEQFLWSIVFIAMGGSALGKAVQASKLLEAMDIVIRDMIDGLSFYVVVIVLSAVVLVISTFISHTIASVLLVPIAAEVGANLPVPHPNLLMFLTGLICSTGMGMPVSGFPNQTAATQTDDVGELYLTNVDFLKNGVPASIIAAVVVATLGFALMKAIGLQ